VIQNQDKDWKVFDLDGPAILSGYLASIVEIFSKHFRVSSHFTMSLVF